MIEQCSHAKQASDAIGVPAHLKDSGLHRKPFYAPAYPRVGLPYAFDQRKMR
jgi:hypothetical protein